METTINVEKVEDALRAYLKNILADYKLLRKQGKTEKELEEFLAFSFDGLLNWAGFGFSLED